MSGMSFVKQETYNFKHAIKGTKTKGNQSLKILFLLLLGTAESCEDLSMYSPAQMMIHIVTAVPATDSILLMTLKGINNIFPCAHFFLEIYVAKKGLMQHKSLT